MGNLKFLGDDGSILTAGKSGKVPPGQTCPDEGGIWRKPQYCRKVSVFFQPVGGQDHPDHLGSTSYITDASGEVYQHLEYFAFGETFVEEHSNTNRTPYLYNGKELDEETGLYYYGARYYDPVVSVWLSVDPMAEDFSNISPFAYTHNNPIKYVDPTGMSTKVIDNGDGTYKVVGGNLNDKDLGIYVVGKNNEGAYVRTGQKIGESLTHSFYNADTHDPIEQQGWKGTIDVNSTESRDFVDKFKPDAEKISIIEYMKNAMVKVYENNNSLVSEYNVLKILKEGKILKNDSADYIKNSINCEYIDLNRIWGIKRFRW